MLRNNIIEIFGQTWPTLLICMVIIISLRVVYLIKNKEKIILHRELITIAFITYVLCLFYVVTFQDVSWSSSNASSKVNIRSLVITLVCSIKLNFKGNKEDLKLYNSLFL